MIGANCEKAINAIAMEILLILTRWTETLEIKPLSSEFFQKYFDHRNNIFLYPTRHGRIKIAKQFDITLMACILSEVGD